MFDLRDVSWQRSARSSVPLVVGLFALITVLLLWRNNESWSGLMSFIGLIFSAFVFGGMLSSWLERNRKNSVLLPRSVHDIGYLNQHSAAALAADFEFAKDLKDYWKVLLCHGKQDQELVSNIAKALEERGINSLMDDSRFRLGIPLERAASGLLNEVDSVILFVGSDERPWQDLELRAILTTAVQQERPVIPIFLPGVNPKQARLTLPIFLRDLSALEFSGVDDPNAIQSLAAKITRKGVGTRIEG